MTTKNSVPVSPTVSAMMRGNRRADTRPELAIRSLVHRAGLRFRKDFPIRLRMGRQVRPDIVFTRHRIAVFVDGCFWHLCPQHGRVPGGANSSYWAGKFARNRARDEEDTAALLNENWLVIRVWEHEPSPSAAERIIEAVRERIATG